MTSFGSKTLLLMLSTLLCYFTYRNLSNSVRIVSIRVSMQKLCYSEVDFLVLTFVIQEDAMITHIIHGKGASHVIMMKKTLEELIL